MLPLGKRAPAPGRDGKRWWGGYLPAVGRSGRRETPPVKGLGRAGGVYGELESETFRGESVGGAGLGVELRTAEQRTVERRSGPAELRRDGRRWA